jgi:hypothetical protein
MSGGDVRKPPRLPSRLVHQPAPHSATVMTLDYGFKSHHIVLRRQQSEDWRKQPELISANLATEAVIDTLIGPETPAAGATAGAQRTSPAAEDAGPMPMKKTLSVLLIVSDSLGRLVPSHRDFDGLNYGLHSTHVGHRPARVVIPEGRARR